jgi:hypothetical protein
LFGSRLPQFCAEHVPPIRYIRDVKYEDLVEFLDRQPGRTLSNILDGVATSSDHGHNWRAWISVSSIIT